MIDIKEKEEDQILEVIPIPALHTTPVDVRKRNEKEIDVDLITGSMKSTEAKDRDQEVINEMFIINVNLYN